MPETTTMRAVLSAAYAAGALLAVVAGRSGRRDRTFWYCAAAVLVVLGISKLTALQDRVTTTLRDAVKLHGLYRLHHQVQGLILVGVCALLLIGGIALARRLDGRPITLKIGAAALAVLLVFVAVRAESIHMIDTWVTATAAGLRRGWWVELAAIGLISAAAIGYLAAARKA
jgi:hypothetical protein